MKTINHFIQFMILAIFMASFIPMNAQEIQIGQAFSSDTVFSPFNGEHDFYSFKMNGYIELLSDSSLVRVVLIDDHGNHWLVYEAYPLIDSLNSFSVQDACDETCYLNKITPDSIRVDIINAIVSIEKFTYDLNEIQNVHDLQAQQKWVNDSIKIFIMNRRIQEEHMYWRAGITDNVLLFFSEKELKFGKKYYLDGFDYYKGGIFEYSSHRTDAQETFTIIDEFDWRNRHDANDEDSYYYDGDPDKTGWLTPYANLQNPQINPPCAGQGSVCLSCWDFAAIAAAEARVNIYFNSHDRINKKMYDINLAEQQILCQGFPGGCSGGNLGSNGMNFITQNYVKEEECLPYAQCLTTVVGPCNYLCFDDKKVKMEGYTTVSLSSDADLKTALIIWGPLSVSSGPHSILLIGFGIEREGDTVYHGSGINDPDIVIEPNSPLIGKNVWFCKNSENGFEAKYYGNYTIFFEAYRFTGIIQSLNTSYAHQCKDEDGDGYYWWGVDAMPEDCNCPPGITNDLVYLEDCNDNNIEAGPYASSQYNPFNDPLYTCTSNSSNCITSEEPIKIDENYSESTLWWDNRHIHQDVVIYSGYTLTITGEVFFSTGAKIYVAPRARLVLQGTGGFPAKLSSACEDFWGGIEIGGNPFESQNTDPINHELAQYQGTVIINSEIIEKAECGIKTLNPQIIPGEWPTGGEPMCCSSSGGIIQATNAIFRNNKIGVEFYPYRWFNGDKPDANKSSFSACTFETTSLLLKDADPEYFLKLDGINKLFITGCTFQNNYYENKNPLHLTPTYDHRGIGIWTYNSELQIELPTSPNSTTFYRLKRGIYGMCSGMGLSDISIFNSKFYSNESGTYLSGYSEINHVDIENDEFYFTENFGASSLYGLYMNECSGYTVTLNKFLESGFSGSGSEQLIGVIVNNSGPKTNYIYNNKEIQGLTTGLQSQNINRGTYTFPDNIFPVPWNIETGLHFVCNDFENCINDIADLKDDNVPDWAGLTHYQRNSESSVGTQQPAGNTFSPSHYYYPSGQYDIEIDPSPKVKDILYKYHTDPLYSPSIRLWPKVVNNPDQVNYEATNLTYSKSESCPDLPPSNISKYELELALSQLDNKIDSLLNLLHSLTDDGSTDTLKNMVENSSPNQSYDVYHDLMNASPFLSDTVLKTSIIKEDVLQNPMIRDIMVANPQSAKNGDLLNTLDNRYDPMPDSMWADILEGRDTIGAMEQLQSELSGWIQLHDEYFNGLIRYFINDTIDQNPSDSLIGLLQNDFNLISRYNLISYYLEHHNFTQAGNTLQEISNDFNLNSKDQQICQNFSDLISVLAQLVNDTLGYSIPDSVQSVILQGLLTDDDNLPAAYARNILIATGLLNYQEPVLLESSQKSLRIVHHYGNKAKRISDFKVYPNPCKDYVIVAYKKENPSDLAECSVLNSTGTKLASYDLRKVTDQIVIPFQSFPSGTYYIRLQVNGKNKGSCRLIKIY